MFRNKLIKFKFCAIKNKVIKLNEIKKKKFSSKVNEKFFKQLCFKE